MSVNHTYQESIVYPNATELREADREYEIRNISLQRAFEMEGAKIDPDRIVRDAEVFAAYLRGITSYRGTQ